MTLDPRNFQQLLNGAASSEVAEADAAVSRFAMRSHSQIDMRKASGQSTVEFMMMLPVILSVLFFSVQMGLYFTTLHYGSYTAFATARAQQGAFSPTYNDIQDVANLMLTGDVWGTAVVREEQSAGETSGVSVELGNFQALVPFPFISSLMPDMRFKTEVHLGPTECRYEYAAESDRPEDQFDNNIDINQCPAAP